MKNLFKSLLPVLALGVFAFAVLESCALFSGGGQSVPEVIEVAVSKEAFDNIAKNRVFYNGYPYNGYYSAKGYLKPIGDQKIEIIAPDKSNSVTISMDKLLELYCNKTNSTLLGTLGYQKIRQISKDVLKSEIDPSKIYTIWFRPGDQLELARIEIEGETPTLTNVEKIVPIVEQKANDLVENTIFLGRFRMYYWKKAFTSKEEAQKWLEDIYNRWENTAEVVDAREKLFNKSCNTFKSYPSKTWKDDLLKNKNNLIEGYKRFSPIVADINKVVKKGVVLNKIFGNYPFRSEDSVTEEYVINGIKWANNTYDKLIDTYPVN